MFIIRTQDEPKRPYIPLFFHPISGPDYYVPPYNQLRGLHEALPCTCYQVVTYCSSSILPPGQCTNYSVVARSFTRYQAVMYCSSSILPPGQCTNYSEVARSFTTYQAVMGCSSSMLPPGPIGSILYTARDGAQGNWELITLLLLQK